jgi:group II intron reverse transcriptase/maturase
MRRVEQRQLNLGFADSARKGGGLAGASGVPDAKAWLQRITKVKASNSSTATVSDTSRLLEQVASGPNMAQALRHVAGNQGAAGVDGQSVEEVVQNVRSLLPKLRHALLAGTYEPGDIRRVWIPKSGGGQRGLGIPNVIDRWVQEAIRLVLEPIFEPTFHPSSHGFRPGRGAQTAIAEAKRYIEQGREIVVDLDLAKFFDTVNWQRLLARLAQRVKDKRVLRLIHRMLRAKVVMPDGTKVLVTEGTPQGGPLSPLLSNIVLDELDWEMARRGLCFVRYADDANIYVRSDRAGQRVMASIRRFIEGRLRLKVNEEKSSVTTPEEAHFLGFRFRKGEEDRIEVELSERSVKRMNARLRDLTPRTWGNSLAACIEQLNPYLRGWLAYFGLCTKAGAYRFRYFDQHLRRRLRAIIVKHKKCSRHLYRHLRACGVEKGVAIHCAYRTRGVWPRSITNAMHRAYPNAWFEERVYTLWAEWQRQHPEPAMASDGQLLLGLEMAP